jgi:hypothetical protein
MRKPYIRLIKKCPEIRGVPGLKGFERETYLVAREPEALTLTRVRLGTGGMEETLEPPLSLAGE